MPPPAVWGLDRGVFPQECTGGRQGQQSVPRQGLLNDKDIGERGGGGGGEKKNRL